MISTLADHRAFLDRLAIKAPNLTLAPYPLFTSRLTVCQDSSAEPDWAVAGPYTGAPYAAMLLETLVAAGVRQVIVLGWCGSIDTRIAIGDIVIADAALSEDGTSPLYGLRPGQAVPGCPELSAQLSKALDGRDRRIHKGRVWSTDAVFQETPAKIKHFNQQGAIGVEMETAALFTIARFRQIRIAACLIVSDELGTFKWNPGFKSPTFKTTRQETMEALVRLCLRS
jgi:uridine phosphorylase